jgi:ribosomal-protein-alanine N-acetyltransferase
MDFTLRSWTLKDAVGLPEYANNFKIARFMMDRFPHPYTIEDAKAFISLAIKDDPVTLFAIDINGRAAGGIGIHPQPDVYKKNAELGYWLAEPYWRQGIISSAIRQIVHYTFGNFAVDRIFARPFGTNLPSQRVLEKIGFTLEGRFEKTIFKHGEYLDELVYAIRR